MTLTELTQQVYTITNRPDRIAETLSAIQSATLKMHQSDFYWKDIFEAGYNAGSNAIAYEHDIDYRSIIPLFRAWKYIRKWSPDLTGQNPLGCPGKLLTLVEPMNVFDDYHAQKTDVYYGAGQYVHVKSSTLDQYYILGCYINPNITSSLYSSWIAIDHPFAIIYEAAAMVFKAVGKDEEATTYRTLNADQIGILKQNNVTALGF